MILTLTPEVTLYLGIHRGTNWIGFGIESSTLRIGTVHQNHPKVECEDCTIVPCDHHEVKPKWHWYAGIVWKFWKRDLRLSIRAKQAIKN